MYSDYIFYKGTYYGDLIEESKFEKFSSKASDFIDTITFRRLIDQFPTDEWLVARIKKCECALAEIYFQIEELRNSSLVLSSSGNDDSGGTGIIKSRTAGNESITYVTSVEMAGKAKELSAVHAAVGDYNKINNLLYLTAKEYLSGVPDSSGTLLLYAGIG